jgi:hypothetical protein
MSAVTMKQKILQALEQLPENGSVKDAIEQLCFLAKVEEGLRQSDSSETISHDEVKRRLHR